MNIDYAWVQSRLLSLGFDPGKVDGIRGPITDAAVVAFKRSIGFQARPFIGPLTLAALGRTASETTRGPSRDLPWMDIARRVLGKHELRDNTFLRRWLGSDGRSLGDPAKLPWCGDYVETCVRLALPDEPFPGALGQNPYWARNWALFGQPTRPTYGAVCAVRRGSGGHVFFLLGQDAGHWYALGGNQSNSVSVSRIAKSRGMLGCRWPSSFAPRAITLPAMTPGQTIQTTNEA